MHLELTEILVCPYCGPGHGLIAFVDRMKERRIVEGRLDCPMCERRHAIRDGVVRLDSASGAGPSQGDRTPPGPSSILAAPDAGELPEDAAAMAAALLGPAEGSEVLLLAAGTRVLGAALADLRSNSAVVTCGGLDFDASGDVDSHARVYPVVVPGDSRVAGFPVRGRALGGVVLSGGVGRSALADAVRALSPGSRLVVLGPTPAVAAALSELADVEELAADSRAWVGSRL